MKIYNTAAREKQELTALNADGVFRIYACGPTVYNYIHIGNARFMCVFDVLRRYLEWRGGKVMFVQNYTDIDDKLINRAKEENTTVEALALKYIDEFVTDAKGLNVLPATVHPKATENIDAILELIAELISKGYAYEVNGDVYFRTLKFSEYGKLSHQPMEDLEAGARISASDIKENPMDFALWKAAKEGEPYWDSPYGKGRPGWHIECSAMAGRYLGKTIDLHCGGQDLIFPHHENEIAQSECANGCEFSRFWMHNGYINVDNKKMSKSLGNFFTVRDVAKEFGYEPIRFLLISAHYRSPINYSIDLINQSINALDRLYTCRENMQDYIKSGACGGYPAIIEKADMYKNRFTLSMDDDLNTADAISQIFELCRECNIAVSSGAAENEIIYALDVFNELCGVLGLLYTEKDNSLDAEVESLIKQRADARAAKDFAAADAIRDQLTAMGIELLDTKDGVKWKKL